MREDDVLSVTRCLEEAGIEFWLDGGWGVDALLGCQTRDHGDLDLVVADVDIERAEQALRPLGYRHDSSIEPGLPARFVLVDERGAEVDLHIVVFDRIGNGWQPLPDSAWGQYPLEGLTGKGIVGAKPVPCITAELQLRHHLGYRWSENDVQDMTSLAAEFGLSLPPPYAER